MVETISCPQSDCYETFREFDGVIKHLERAHGAKNKANRSTRHPWGDTPDVVDGGVAKDPMQSVADAERTVTSAENTMKRAQRALGRYHKTLAALVALGVLGVALVLFSGFLDTVGLESMANAARGVGIPLMVISAIASAFHTINASDNKVFEDRKEAEKQVDEATEQRDRVYAVLPESVSQYQALTSGEAVARLQALSK